MNESDSRLKMNWPRIGLITLFGTVILYRFAFLFTHGASMFTEPIIDIGAAREWLNGGDPWRVGLIGDVSFAGPPTMLLAYAPFVFVDPFLMRWVLGTLAIAAGFLAIRRLGLPVWWILWPPLFEAVIHASFDSLIPALLLSSAAPLAAFVKPYAAAALITKPRLLVVTAICLVVTLPLLPWRMFIGDLPQISTTLRDQANQGGLSAFGNLAAMVAVGISMISIGWRSRWVAPAGLWPYAQLHYGAMGLALASRAPLLAACMAIPLAGAAPMGIVAYAIHDRVRRQSPRRDRERERDAAFQSLER
jgi:hypothetical protein